MKVAKDATLLINNNPCTRAESTSLFSPEDDALHLKWPQHMKTGQPVRLGDSMGPKTAQLDDYSMQCAIKEADDLEPTHEELELLQSQLSNGIAVRSRRQTERKARRTRAAEKAAATVVSVKSGSTVRKKRASLQDIDHSDPLRYLRATTSTSRLLTATEEIELSEGIQVCYYHLQSSEDFQITLFLKKLIYLTLVPGRIVTRKTIIESEKASINFYSFVGENYC